jgi:hypothetical protein
MRRAQEQQRQIDLELLSLLDTAVWLSVHLSLEQLWLARTQRKMADMPTCMYLASIQSPEH